MKSTITVLLITIFSLQAFYQAGVMIWFHINKAYVASVLCENKARPELKCNGNCVLMKKMKQADSEETGLPSSSYKWIEIAPCILSGVEPDLNIVKVSVRHVARPKAHYTFQPVYDVFHPPTS